MNIKDIVALAHSGFSAEQIATMAALPQENVKPEVAVPVIPEPVVQTPVVKATLEPKLIKPDANIQTMIAELSKLTTTIQAQGILNSNMPQVKQETTTDILASIIAPPKREEN